MEAIKQPAVAGQFYSDDAEQLRKSIEAHMQHGFKCQYKPKAIIAPHAGYIYSGEIAGSAYSVLPNLADQIRRVILLGPCHRVPVRRFAVASYEAFETPLGTIEVDTEVTLKLLEDKIVECKDTAFAQEHSLEVHLPFLQMYLKDFKIVPILVGSPAVEETSAVLKRLYGDESTLIVISSDLSHYLDYDSANDIDMLTSQQIVSLDYAAIKDEQACGRYPVKGMMHLARELGLTARAIDLRNSGDTQGDKSRVVGYGAYHFYEPNEKLGFYSAQQKASLKDLAKQSILFGVKEGSVAKPQLDKLPFDHAIQRATFVTLEKNGQLRGCIGSLEAHQPLALDLVENAYKAAFKDPRFKPLQEDELGETRVFISLLSDPTPIEFGSEADLIHALRKTIDGLIIEDQGRRAIFLPSVWESLRRSP